MQNSKSCNSKNCFSVFEEIIVTTKNFEIGLFLPEKGNIAIKKQTISGLFDFKTKSDSKKPGVQNISGEFSDDILLKYDWSLI